MYSTISPNQFEFKNFFRDLISKYEETAGKIQTLLHEPRFKLFYETPIYELTRVERLARFGLTPANFTNPPSANINNKPNNNNEELEEALDHFDEPPSYLPLVNTERMGAAAFERPWPEVDFLFGEDESYQELVYDVMRVVTHSINSVSYFAESYNQYCRMVFSIIRLDIGRSIAASGPPPGRFYSSVFSPDDFHYLLSKHSDQVSLPLLI